MKKYTMFGWTSDGKYVQVEVSADNLELGILKAEVQGLDIITVQVNK